MAFDNLYIPVSGNATAANEGDNITVTFDRVDFTDRPFGFYVNTSFMAPANNTLPVAGENDVEIIRNRYVEFGPGIQRQSISFATKKDNFQEGSESVWLKLTYQPIQDYDYSTPYMLFGAGAINEPYDIPPVPADPTPVSAPKPSPYSQPGSNNNYGIVINGNGNSFNFGNIYNIADSFNTSTVITTNEIIGTPNRDFLTGTTGNDLMRGGKNDDEIRGGRGDDIMYGGLGNDIVRAGVGTNTFANNNDGYRDQFFMMRESTSSTADTIESMDAFDRIYITGGSQLTIGEVRQGLGIFDQGVLQAIFTGGNLSANQLASQVSAI